jgi:hypothetical protein
MALRQIPDSLLSVSMKSGVNSYDIKTRGAYGISYVSLQQWTILQKPLGKHLIIILAKIPKQNCRSEN